MYLGASIRARLRSQLGGILESKLEYEYNTAYIIYRTLSFSSNSHVYHIHCFRIVELTYEYNIWGFRFLLYSYTLLR